MISCHIHAKEPEKHSYVDLKLGLCQDFGMEESKALLNRPGINHQYVKTHTLAWQYLALGECHVGGALTCVHFMVRRYSMWPVVDDPNNHTSIETEDT